METTHTDCISDTSSVEACVKTIKNMSDEDFLELSFESAEEVGNLFGIYAAVHGFSVRKQDSRRRKNGVIVMHRWCCSRQGYTPHKQDQTISVRYRPSGRVGCGVALQSRLEDNGRWHVRYINLSHNHELVPSSLTCFMKERRNITPADMMAVQRMLSVGIRQCDVMRLLGHVSGGLSRVGFTNKDMNNRVLHSRLSAELLTDFDAGFAYLTSKKRDDAGMALVTYVEEDIATRLYWADSTCRLDYHAFGDVIALDSTFKTNVYGMQMVVIVGVNHHHQTVVLGSALIATETIDDYNWIFRTHTTVMGGNHPISVVTDADKAMIAAVREVWPEAKHRLCLWHFNRNIARHVQMAAMRKRLSDIMFSTKSPAEVEQMWDDLWANRGNMNNRWLQQIYACRHMWWHTYLQGHFWAELRSTQRCERMHSYMKGYVKAKHRLHEFLHHFERAIADLRHKELQSDYRSSQKIGPFCTMLRRLEEDASRLYTLQSFRKVQVQLQRETLHYVVAKNDGNINRVYKVAEFDSSKPVVDVSYGLYTNEVSCSCPHFGTFGFPCGHALHIAKVEGMTNIPQNLVMRRWTKKAKGRDVPVPASDAYGISVGDVRQGVLMAGCRRLCHLGAASSEIYEAVQEDIAAITTKFEKMCAERSGDVTDEGRREAKNKMKRVIKGKMVLPDFGDFNIQTQPGNCHISEDNDDVWNAVFQNGESSVCGQWIN